MQNPIEYNDEGHGEVIIMIHGFCESKEIWSPFVSYFKQYYRVIAIDLPGFGESTYYESINSIDELSELICQFTSSLNIDKYILIGHSLGGYINLAHLEKYPKRITKLINLHSTPFEDSEEKKHNRDKTIHFIKRFGVHRFTDAFVPHLFTEANRLKFSEHIQAIKNHSANVSEDTFVDYTMAMKNRKGKINVIKNTLTPILMMHGALDNTLNLELIKSLEGINKNLSLEIIENVGHIGMLEELNIFIKKLNQFLTNN